MTVTGRARSLAAHLPSPVRRVLRRTLRRVRERDSGGTVDRRVAFLAQLDRQIAPAADRARLDLRVAVAVTPTLAVGLSHEWRQQLLDPVGWPDALVHGGDAAVDLLVLQWAHRAVPGLSEATVGAVIARAREHGIPVVLWATDSSGEPWPEDHPVSGADACFADDAGTAAAWSARAGQEVGHLGPAAHPAVQSPARTGTALRRRHAVAVVVPDTSELAAFASLPLKHVDVWPTGPPVPPVPDASSSSETRVPEKAQDDREADRIARLRRDAVVHRTLDSVGPTLGHYRVATALRGAPGSIWPLIEATMAGTPLVLDRATMDRLPADLQAVHTLADTPEEVRYDTAARLWQRELSDREGLIASRAARAAHSLSDRVDRMVGSAGLETPARDRSVSVIVPTNRPHQLDNVLANLARQREHELGTVQLVLVLHGLDLDTAQLRASYAEAGVSRLEVVRADPALTLGACMNLGVDAADGRWIAKVDDDNYYGRHYLTDLVDAFDYSGAGIVGKWAHYVWLRSSGAVILRSAHAEYRFERLVQGGSMVFDGDVVRQLRFADLPRAVDTDILGRAKEAGVATFSADRFNFVSIRGTDRFAHTWPIADTALMNRAGDLSFFGDPRPHVDV